MKAKYLALLAALSVTSAVQAADALTIDVHRDANCGCCKKWISHLEANGFKVVDHVESNMSAVKQSLDRATSIADVALSAGESVSDLLNQLKEKVVAAKDSSLKTQSRELLNADFQALLKAIASAVDNAAFDGGNGFKASMAAYGHRIGMHLRHFADAKLIPDPDAVIRRFGPEFDKLLYLSLMGDWERTLDAPTASGMLF